MNSRREKVNLLFNKYSQNLTYHFPEYSDKFLCPLCYRIFDRKALEDGMITLEHVIPESLGGRILTITCKDCNTVGGRLLDTHFLKRIMHNEILRGESSTPLYGELRAGGGSIKAELYLSKNNPNVSVVGKPERSNPTLLKKAVDAMDQDNATFTFSSLLGFQDIPSRNAILKYAYLMMFYYFGYGYIKYDIIQKIRQKILITHEENEFLNGIITLTTNPTLDNAVTIITNPKELNCYLIVIKFSATTNERIGVALPGLDSFQIGFSEQFKRNLDKNSSINCDFSLIKHDYRYITEQNRKDMPITLWQANTKKDI